MQLPRWNNCKNPRTRGKTAQPSISHSGQGLEGKKSSSLPVEGGIFSLTFPFIDQAISRFDRWSLSVIGILRQHTTWAVRPCFAAATIAQIRVPNRFPE